MIKDIRTTEIILGRGKKLVTNGRKIFQLRKSLFAAKDINKGEKFT